MLSLVFASLTLSLNVLQSTPASTPDFSGSWTMERSRSQSTESATIEIKQSATAIIIVHNHPSGDPSPSSQDIRLTKDLIDAGRHMRVTVHDHVIVGSQGRSSMKALGLI